MTKVLLSGNEAIARGAYEAGVQVATGYPGTPSSEILREIAAQYRDDIYAEWSTNEKVAMDAAAGAAYSGRRSMVTTKQVGMNVLADALLYTVYTGVEAGLVVVTADDPGIFSSQNEQDNRWYARLAKIPMLEPQDSQQAKDYVIAAIALSERYDTPVLLRTGMRVSHAKSIVELGQRQGSPDEAPPFVRNQEKYVCTAMWAKRRHPVVEQRLLDLVEFAETTSLNRIVWKERSVGIVTSGVVATYVQEVFPRASVLVLGMTFPLPRQRIREFAAQVDRLLIIEELDPFLEEQILSLGVVAVGKDLFPACDELLPDRLQEIAFNAGLLTPSEVIAPINPSMHDLPPRTPVLCAGCPHRSTYFWLAKLKVPVAGDIGCYNLGCLPPFNAQHTMGCMGASIGVLHGMSIAGVPERGVATIGDSTFFHSGIPALANLVHNQGSGVTIIMDNATTAMTGHQDHPGTDWSLHTETAPRVPIEPLVRSLGVSQVRVVDAFDVSAVRAGLEEALAYDGPAVLITEGPCVQVSRPPLVRYEVNAGMCVACGTCFRLGCPAIIKSDERYESTGKQKAAIDPTLCVGCDMCRQVCPASAIHPPEEAIL